VRGARVAWLLLALYFALIPLCLIARGPEPDKGEPLILLVASGFPLVGAVVAAKRPSNAVGWILLAMGLVFGASLSADAYDETGATALAGVLGWFSVWSLYAWLGLGVIALPLVFPDGHVLSPRWRWVLRIAVAAFVFSFVGTGFKPGALGTSQKPDIQNPFGVPALKGVLAAVNVVGEVLFIVAIVAAVASVVVRFRRSRGEARLQLKWFALVGSVMIVGFLVAAVAAAFGDDSPIAFLGNIGWPVGLLSLIVGIPVATGIAMLRYRLYEVDVVINRTLVYGLLTATLAGAYLGPVLLLQLALDSLTSGSSLAVAISTLAVAALFRPARARIQGVVDRRFYRHKYDAALTLAGFSARLREQVDLETLGGELRGVVVETMQPAHVSLWLKEPGR
jgi:hypothetical protein